MSSPFPPNATLIFQVPTGATTIDSLGNPSAVTEPLTVLAYLRPRQKVTSNLEGLSGGDMSQITLEGRIVGKLLPDQTVVEILALPPTILSGAKAEAVVGGISGEFFYEASIPSVWGVDEILGGKLRGTLVTETAWGNAL